jgi:serine/threonine-protein kinase RsbW
MTGNAPDIHLRLMSQPKLLASVRSMVVALSERIGFGEVESGHVALAVDEALANIIRHGYKQRENETIEIDVWALTDPNPGIRIIIEDEAPQIEPDAIKGRDLDNVQPGGLGVHIMREVMNTCSFEKRNKKGMRVIMEKLLEENAAGSSSSNSEQEVPGNG